MINKYEIILDIGPMKVEIRGVGSLDEALEFMNSIELERRLIYRSNAWCIRVRDIFSKTEFIFTVADEDFHWHAEEVERDDDPAFIYDPVPDADRAGFRSRTSDRSMEG